MALGVATFIIVIYVSSHEYNVHDSFFFLMQLLLKDDYYLFVSAYEKRNGLWNKFGLNVKMLEEIH